LTLVYISTANTMYSKECTDINGAIVVHAIINSRAGKTEFSTLNWPDKYGS